jgi:hypothetical protein
MPKKSHPIVIEVDEEFMEIIKQRVTTVSNWLYNSNYENLLPVDLIQIKGAPVRSVTAFDRR